MKLNTTIQATSFDHAILLSPPSTFLFPRLLLVRQVPGAVGLTTTDTRAVRSSIMINRETQLSLGDVNIII